MKATAADSLNDCISTAAVVGGMLVFHYFHLNVDGIVGIFVACFVLWGEVSGFKYTVALPEKAFEKLTVKIDGECKLDKPNDKNYPVVIFDGLEMRPYWTPEGYKVSATAKNIRAVNAGKA